MKQYVFSATLSDNTKTYRTVVWADNELDAVVEFKKSLIKAGWSKEDADSTPFKKHF